MGQSSQTDGSFLFKGHAVEALAFAERVKLFGEATGQELEEAEKAMLEAEKAVILDLARRLEEKRGVYDAELNALGEEGGWIKPYDYLKEQAWRWEAQKKVSFTLCPWLPSPLHVTAF